MGLMSHYTHSRRNQMAAKDRSKCRKTSYLDATTKPGTGAQSTALFVASTTVWPGRGALGTVMKLVDLTAGPCPGGQSTHWRASGSLGLLGADSLSPLSTRTTGRLLPFVAVVCLLGHSCSSHTSISHASSTW